MFFLVYSPYLDEVFRSSPSPLDGHGIVGMGWGRKKKRKSKGFEIDERALSHSLTRVPLSRKSSLLRVSAGL